MKKPTTSITYRLDGGGLHYFIGDAPTLNITDHDGDEINIENITPPQITQMFRNALCSACPAINAQDVADKWHECYVKQLQDISASLTELLLTVKATREAK